MKKMLLVLAIICFAVPAVAYQDVTPTDAYSLATSNDNVYILDVRTLAEWVWVGHPGINKSGDGADLAGKVVNVSVKVEIFNEMFDNPFFVKSVEKLFPNKDDVILITMCRSGSRSVAAAKLLEEAGYLNVMNMATGFEGGSDANGYRTRNGWKVDGLPYNTSRSGGYTVGFHGQGNAFGQYK